jgi:transcriptional regulator with XRE-family HTH domain
MTQEEVAAKTGLTYRYYQEVERGGRNPTLRVLCEIANVLEVAVADIVDVEPSKRRSVPLAQVRPTPPKAGRKPRRDPKSR